VKLFNSKPAFEEAQRYQSLASLLKDYRFDSLHLRLQLLASLAEERASLLAGLEKECDEHNPAFHLIKQFEELTNTTYSSRKTLKH
jgi:hypothetical protein